MAFNWQGTWKNVLNQTGRIKAFAEILPDGTQKLASKEMFQEVKSEVEKSTDTIVYVHGYAVKWIEAVANALSLQAMLNKKDENVENQKVIVILFTWPSDGRYVLAEDTRRIFLGAYRSDRIEAEASGAALGRGIQKLRDFFIAMRKAGQSACNQCIHILCHSMGNYVLQNALTKVQTIRQRLRCRLSLNIYFFVPLMLMITCWNQNRQWTFSINAPVV